MTRLALIVAALLASQGASAATAFLMSCQSGSSVTGHLVWTGTYQYGGRYFERTFSGQCPYSVEVY